MMTAMMTATATMMPRTAVPTMMTSPALSPCAAWSRPPVGAVGVGSARPPPLLTPRAVPRSRPPLALAPPPVFAQLAGLSVLTSVVVVHELGHFAAARLQGIRVDEFSIGFGPAIYRRPIFFFAHRTHFSHMSHATFPISHILFLYRRPAPDADERGVAYALRALPLGGYVAFPRRVTEEEARAEVVGESERRMVDPDDPDLLENRPFQEQANP